MYDNYPMESTWRSRARNSDVSALSFWTLEEVDIISSTFIISNFHSEFVLPKRSISEKEVP